MKPTIQILAGGAELLDRVEPLWLELRSHHAELNPVWHDLMLKNRFEGRREGFLQRAAGPEDLSVLLARDATTQAEVGYCVSLIDSQRAGVIESLYIAERARGQGVGTALMKAALAWFDRRAAATVSLEVLIGNDYALRFYEQFGFKPRTTVMRRMT